MSKSERAILKATKKALIVNMMLFLLAGASGVTAVYVYTLGKTSIVVNIHDAAKGNLKATIPLDIVAGDNGTLTLAGGNFTLYRTCNMTLTVSSNCTATYFAKADFKVTLTSIYPEIDMSFDLLLNSTWIKPLTLAKGDYTVAYVFDYKSIYTPAATCVITTEWVVK